MRTWKLVHFIEVGLVLLAMTCFALRSADAAAPDIGEVAPEIEGEDLDGVPFKLSDYRGKVVVLDFWGNW